jgi:hypothetical protein
MSSVTLAKIDERLQLLPPEKLQAVYEFISLLLRQDSPARDSRSGAIDTMLASEAVLARDWNRPEEDEAWADL